MNPLVVYSPGYDYSFFGVERFHPFDARRASRGRARAIGGRRWVGPGARPRVSGVAAAVGGEGFCVFNDVAWAIARLRQDGRLGADDRVLYVGLDAHPGNGVARCFADDRRVTIVDAYNEAIYPDDRTARARIDHPVPLPPYTADDGHLPRIESALTRTLNEFDGYALAVYNAGTDIHEAGPLGALRVSADGVRARDRFVIDVLRACGIPTLVLPSGGYGPLSFQLIADALEYLAPLS